MTHTTHPPTTGAAAAIWQALTRNPGSITVTLATIATVGYSTAGKVLAALEKDGLAHRTPGGTLNGRKAPDLWHPTIPATETGTMPEADTGTQNEPSTVTDLLPESDDPALATTSAPNPDPAPTSAGDGPTLPKTNARAALRQALNTHPGSTTATLATIAGTGRSTAGKALAALERDGLARRNPSGLRNGCPIPGRWYPTTPAEAEPVPNPEPTTGPDAPDTEGAPSAPDTADTPEPEPDPETARTPDVSTPNAPETTDTAGPAPDGDANAPTTAPDTADAPEAPTPTGTGPTEDGTRPSNAPPAALDHPGPAFIPAQRAAERLVPGGLRHMVYEHLAAHPTTDFTPTAISRAVNRSSGAIANALVTLTHQGHAEQVSGAPRTYRYRHNDTLPTTPGTVTRRPGTTKAPATSRTAPPATGTPRTAGERLAPGRLRQMVLDHLAAHPDATFTATALGRALARSSGAIGNALVTLIKFGHAEQVSVAPRTYRYRRTSAT
jgi:hypothetical protein